MVLSLYSLIDCMFTPQFGFTPLATAVSFSKRDVVIELLDNGADANAQTDVSRYFVQTFNSSSPVLFP